MSPSTALASPGSGPMQLSDPEPPTGSPGSAAVRTPGGFHDQLRYEVSDESAWLSPAGSARGGAEGAGPLLGIPSAEAWLEAMEAR